jgi:hypothetical protein
MQLSQTHMVLKPTSVGNNFLLLAQINVRLVASVKKNSHHMLIPNISPGKIITALAIHDKNSTIL